MGSCIRVHHRGRGRKARRSRRKGLRRRGMRKDDIRVDSVDVLVDLMFDERDTLFLLRGKKPLGRCCLDFILVLAAPGRRSLAVMFARLRFGLGLVILGG